MSGVPQAVFWAHSCSPLHYGDFPSFMVMLVILVAVVSKFVSKYSKCNLLVMKFNASKTKTMVVPRLHIIHPQSIALTLDGTDVKDSVDHVILQII